MSVRAAYASWSATYDSDRNLTRDLDETVTREALAGARFESVLEIGCGTGKNTRLLAEIGTAVLALDLSAEMLARARAKVGEDPALAERVRLQVADVTRPWPCADGSFDLVACNLVLEHIEDLQPVFAEAARCLTPGGTLWVSELHPSRQVRGSQARFRDAEGGEVRIEAHVHHVSDFLHAADRCGLTLDELGEHRHLEDEAGKSPRLLTLRWVKGAVARPASPPPAAGFGRRDR